MRGASVVLASLITLTIAGMSQAAMTVDFLTAADRAADREAAVHRELDTVWYGGQLPPVVVEVAPSKAPAATAQMVPRGRATVRAPRSAPARIS